MDSDPDKYVQRIINLRGGWYAASILVPSAAIGWAMGSAGKWVVVVAAVVALTAVSMPLAGRWFESPSTATVARGSVSRRGAALTIALVAIGLVLAAVWLVAVFAAYRRVSGG